MLNNLNRMQPLVKCNLYTCKLILCSPMDYSSIYNLTVNFFLSVRYRWIPRSYSYLDTLDVLETEEIQNSVEWFSSKLKCSILWYLKELGPLVHSLCIHTISHTQYMYMFIHIYTNLHLLLICYLCWLLTTCFLKICVLLYF